MEEKIKLRIKWHLERLQESINQSFEHLAENTSTASLNAFIGSLVNEDKRIIEAINLAKTLREFGN